MAKNFQNQTLDENELIKIRREKLKGFIDKGVEPFGARYEVSHHAADVRAEFGEIEGESRQGELCDFSRQKRRDSNLLQA